MRRKGTSNFIFLLKRRIYEKGEQQRKSEQQRKERAKRARKRAEQSAEQCSQELRYEELQIMKAKNALKKGAKMSSREDVLGSYTGVYTEDGYEVPVQDADDL